MLVRDGSRDLPGAHRLPPMNNPAPPHLMRTCPWCADARVIAFSEEGLVRALTRHLETCPGEDTDESSSGA